MQPFAADENLQQCPYCGELVDVTAEATGPSRETYVEDCPVCCRPWRVRVTRQGEDVLVRLEHEDS